LKHIVQNCNGPTGSHETCRTIRAGLFSLKWSLNVAYYQSDRKVAPQPLTKKKVCFNKKQIKLQSVYFSKTCPKATGLPAGIIYPILVTKLANHKEALIEAPNSHLKPVRMVLLAKTQLQFFFIATPCNEFAVPRGNDAKPIIPLWQSTSSEFNT